MPRVSIYFTDSMMARLDRAAYESKGADGYPPGRSGVIAEALEDYLSDRESGERHKDTGAVQLALVDGVIDEMRRLRRSVASSINRSEAQQGQTLLNHAATKGA